MRTFIFTLLISLLPLSALAQTDRTVVDQQFKNWVAKDFFDKARKRGISPEIYRNVMDPIRPNLQLPDLTLPGEKPKTPKRQHQAEFGSPADYFSEKSLGAVISGGKNRYAANAKTLKSIEKNYGVPATVLLAIWGRESAFGTVKIPYNAFEVLATKAFMSSRQDMFSDELLAALEIVQSSYMDAASMKSSWAGALGQPQFMPTSYLKYAVDFDGDGHRNIWTSTADTLASIANYLKLNGWQQGRSWGYEVSVPEAVSCSLEGPDQGKSFAEWQRLGIKPVAMKSFPAGENSRQGFLLMPAGRLGPAFIVTDNFYALKAYNMSDLYALFIGSASDRISGAGAFKAPWQKVDKLYRSDVATMQTVLQKQGFDIGKPDGLAGFKTRRSIGLWQEKHGQKATCFPSRKLIQDIR
ncbi:lytic murein transglycosylase [Bartonella sp. LJL80]